MDFENKTVGGGYFYTRFIASYYRAGGNPNNYRGNGKSLEAWLRSLIIDDAPMKEEDIKAILFLAENGKLELETNAKRFLKGA